MQKLYAFWQKNQKKSGTLLALGAIAAALVIIILINAGIAALPLSIINRDASADGSMYTLSDTTKALYKDLDEDVYLWAVFDTATTDSMTMTFLSRYAALSDKIHVGTLNKMRTNDTVTLEGWGLSDVTAGTIIVETAYRTTAVYAADTSVVFNTELGISVPYSEYTDSSSDYYGPYYYNSTMGLLTAVQYAYYGAYYEQYGYTFEQLPMQLGFSGEQELDNAINYCLVSDTAVIYMMDTGDTALLSSDVTSVLASVMVDVKTWKTNGDAVPADCEALVIFASGTDLRDDEYAAVADYLARGGKVLLTADFQHYANQPKLLALLAAYGLTVNTDSLNFIVEGDTNYMASSYYPYVLYPAVGTHIALSQAGSESVMLAMASEILYDAADTRVTPLYTTSESAVSYFPYLTNEDGSGAYDDPAVRCVGAISESNEGTMVFINCPAVFSMDTISNVSGNFYHLVSLLSYLGDAPVADSVTVTPAVAASVLSVTLNVCLIAAAIFIIAIPVCIIVVGLVRNGKRKKA